MYVALDLSKYIISKCVRDGHPISNLQLQKILYYIQVYFLKHDNIAFPDAIEAWQFGPVVPNVYYYYCGYGAMPITSMHERITIGVRDKTIIDEIVENKRGLDPWKLVEETHRKNGAWDQIYRNGAGNRNVIPTELIKAVG